MVLVTAYRNLQSRGRHGDLQTFHPLRAVGLSVERGWKASRDKGLGAVTEGDVNQVTVAGKLRLQAGERWTAATSCTLQLRPQDAALASTLLRKQRALLADLGLNAWSVDKGGAANKRSLDLLADFSTSKNFGVQGRLWVELKVLAAATFEAEFAKCKETLEELFAKEEKKDKSLGGVLLLAACVGTGGRTAWTAPTLVASLKKRSSPKWQLLAGAARRAARGQCKSTKPPLATLWSKMEWFEQQTGPNVGLLKHFLQGVRLPCKNPGQRASTFNSLLRKGRCQGRVISGRLKNKCGKRPWVATKQTFRKLYTFV